jgi:hypothetical protein
MIIIEGQQSFSEYERGLEGANITHADALKGYTKKLSTYAESIAILLHIKVEELHELSPEEVAHQARIELSQLENNL